MFSINELKGKQVLKTTGVQLGHLTNLIVDQEGSIIALLVEPQDADEPTDEYDRDDEGLLFIPLEKLKSISDYIMVA